jgi:predicted transcriptional regulator
LKPSRARLLSLMEILHALREGPFIRNRLSQLCNINYQRMIEMLDHLEKRGLVSHTVQEGHDLYGLTPEGLKASMSYQWINAMVMGDLPAPQDTSKGDAKSLP